VCQNRVYLHGVRTEPKVALTLDDSPNPDGAEYEEAAIRLQRPVPMLSALPRIIEGLQARLF
jgi:hypothetical protein